MTALNSYATGTASVSSGDTQIVGSGTIWSGVNARGGDIIIVDGLAPVEIKDVTDTTHLTLWAPWTGGNQTAASYTIIQKSPLRFAGAQTMQDVSTLVAALNTNGLYVFVPPDLSAPDPSLGEDNQYAFQATTGKLWQKTGGTWNFVGIFKGFGLPAAWNSATAYVAFDVATLSGTSYVCILANTNQTPPNATYWTVLASIGATGSGSAEASGGVGNCALICRRAASRFRHQWRIVLRMFGCAHLRHVRDRSRCGQMGLGFEQGRGRADVWRLICYVARNCGWFKRFHRCSANACISNWELRSRIVCGEWR
jgi:hypothetical protein